MAADAEAPSVFLRRIAGVVQSRRELDMGARLAWVLLALISSCVGVTWAQQYTTLAEVLHEQSIPFPPTSIPHLSAPITSFAALNDAREFLIAYYLADGKTQQLHYPLLITQYNKGTGQWKHVALDRSQVHVDDSSMDWIGAVEAVDHHGSRYYICLHWNPSAGLLLILKGDLSVDDTLEGWPLAWFPSGALLYSANMAHFVEVNPETVWLYDPGTRQSKQLYPPANDPLRNAFSARLATVIDQSRCRNRNWACDPQRFSSTLSDRVQVNDGTHSLAFRVQFDPEGFVDREEAEDSGKWDDDNYAYIYQLEPFRWREFSVYDLKAKFGTDSLPELLTPEKIESVFATPAPN